MSRINCPKHDDSVASCQVYPTGAYCFAGCGIISHREITRLTGVPIESLAVGAHETRREPEDLDKCQEYISSLPLQEHRGFMLPTDGTGYYLRYPGSKYYLKRQFMQLPKYIGASGHPRPLYIAAMGLPVRLLIIEGEFNASSVAAAIKPTYSGITILSPGGAGGFDNKEMLETCQSFKEVTAVADADAAGISALIKFKAACKIRKIPVTTHIVSEDANEIHQTKGLLAVKAAYEGILK